MFKIYTILCSTENEWPHRHTQNDMMNLGNDTSVLKEKTSNSKTDSIKTFL